MAAPGSAATRPPSTPESPPPVLQLAVKTPNSQVVDLDVPAATLDWTVAQLKRHLTAIHPAKPASNEQKIVYHGRLLHDHLRLRDILRRSTGERQTVHLVVAEPALRRCASEPAANTDPAAVSSARSPMARQASTPLSPSSRLLDRHVSTPPHYPGHLPAQAYSGLRHRAASAGTSPASAAGSPTASAQAYYAYMYQQQWAQHYLYQMQASAAAAGSPDVSPQHAYQHMLSRSFSTPQGGAQQQHFQHQQQAGQAGAAAAATPPAAGAAQPNAAPAAAAAPNPDNGRFAQAGLGAAPMANDVDMDQLGQARTLSAQMALIAKLAFLVLLFGQHATRGRFICICVAAVAIFLYQAGWLQFLFGNRRRQQQQHVQQQADPAQPEDAGQEGADGTDGEGTGDQEEEDEDDDLPPPPPPARTLLEEVTTIVGGFFTSLLPHRHYERVH